MKKYIRIVFSSLAVSVICLSGCNSNSANQLQTKETQEIIENTEELDKDIKSITDYSYTTGMAAIGMSLNTNIDNCENWEMFGYQGNFSFNSTSAGKELGIYDIMSWGFLDDDNEKIADCEKNILLYYGNNYEIAYTTDTSTKYIWEDVKDCKTIECTVAKSEHGGNVLMKWTTNKGEKALIESQPIPPAIGMTAEEVRNSTWGEPKKINKTTTKYGVTEQWVYYNNKYIYFTDGIVDAISE